MHKTLKRDAVCAAVIVILDQLTKGVVVTFFPVGSSHTVIAGFFHWVHVRNRGAAFGIFSNLSENFTVPFFYGASLLALGLLLLYYRSLRGDQVKWRLPIALMMGGALGNLIDRMTRGTVVDFISLHIGERWVDFVLFGQRLYFKLEWPAFNLADSAITISIVWLLLGSMRSGWRKGISLS